MRLSTSTLLSATFLLGCVVSTGCGTQVIYTTKTTYIANQAEDAWQDSRYVYIATGLSGTASAPAGSAESKELGRQAMDRLVSKAQLKRNQALVGVTLEQGVVGGGHDGPVRIVMLRGDVIEFVPRGGRRPASAAAPAARRAPPPARPAPPPPPVVAPPAPPAPPVAPLPAPSCVIDSECLGEQVCQDRKCVPKGS